MGLKTIVPVTGEVNTTNDTWTTVATYTVSTDCNIIITDIFAQGKTTNGTIGEGANATAVHRAKRVGGTLSLMGAIVFLLTFNTGSDTAVKSCSLQMLVSGNNLLLQVKGIGGGSPRNISWYGGFTVILN
jgi:hypothetical protein